MSSETRASKLSGIPYLKCHTHSSNTTDQISTRSGKIIGWGIFLTFIVCITKMIGGWWTGSLALLSDGWHLVGDLVTLLISWWGVRQSLRPVTKVHTFGWYRAEVLTALIANVVLIAIGLSIVWDSFRHILTPEPVQGMLMLIITAVGIVIYGALTWILGQDKDNMNAKSAWLHFVGDIASSVAVLVGAVIIHYTHWYRIDGILSALIGLVIAAGAAKMAWEGVRILLEASPEHIDGNEVEQELHRIDGVHCVSDLHIWSLTPSQIMLTAHVAVSIQTLEEGERIVRQVQMRMWEKFGIHHSTVQLEIEECGKCQECVKNNRTLELAH